MSNGDSPDGFVFPPFVPRSAARPPAPPPPAPPAAAPAAMPWELEMAPAPAAPAEEAPLDELPWLELPEPREPAQHAAPPAAASDADDEAGALPEWMTWDSRAEAEAEAELSGTAQLEGLQEFDPLDAFAARADDGIGTALREEESAAELEPFSYGESDTFPYGGAGAEPAGASGLEMEPGYGFAAEPEEAPAYPAPAAEAGQGFAPGPLEDRFAPGGEFGDEFGGAASEPAPAGVHEEAVAFEPAGAGAGEMEVVVELEPAAPVPAAFRDGGAFGEVADRLEAIARDLRERPDVLLAGGGDDPLALLVTGYVMGYTHGRKG